MNKTAAKIPVYKNPAASPAKRVKDLLRRMTLEEKSGANDVRLAGKEFETPGPPG